VVELLAAIRVALGLRNDQDVLQQRIDIEKAADIVGGLAVVKARLHKSALDERGELVRDAFNELLADVSRYLQEVAQMQLRIVNILDELRDALRGQGLTRVR
jgi:hypothetical protein